MLAGNITIYMGKHAPDIVLKVIRKGYTITIGIDADEASPKHPTFTIPEMYGMNGREVRAWVDENYPQPEHVRRQVLGR